METAVPQFKSLGEAIGMLESAMGYLAGADHSGMPTQVKAQVLTAMERVSAVQAAVRGRAVSAFITDQAFHEYGQKAMRSWCVSELKVTKAAAAAHTAWGRRADWHPLVIEALADTVFSESWATAICRLTDRLPEEHVQDADTILVAAARLGADLEGLTRLAAEIQARVAPPDQDPNPLADRELRLETTLDGAGVLTGDLTPECTVIVRTVLDSLAGSRGPEDVRSHGERYHDALEEALKRLLGTDLLPTKGGKPVTALVHIPFPDLLARDPGSALHDAWIDAVAGQWAAERAGAAVVPGDGGAWLNGEAAAAIACDAMLVPVVTGNPDIAALGPMVELVLAYHQVRSQTSGPVADRAAHAAEMARLEKAIIGQAVALVSGPGGLASFLRRNLLGAGLGGPSLPLDVGDVDRIPWQIRTAVTLRDKHCAWPGGCDQRACGCEPHHTVPRAVHGPTSLAKLALMCWFHHHIVIHTWGWTVTINPDGTMTARKPDGSLFIHGPPPRPG